MSKMPKVMVFYIIYKENIFFQAVHFPPPPSSSRVSAPTSVRRHRHKPPPPPQCCQTWPARRSTARWCHWTPSHRPLLPRAGSSRRWGWRMTSAETCCRCTENPWRLHWRPGSAAREGGKERNEAEKSLKKTFVVAPRLKKRGGRTQLGLQSHEIVSFVRFFLGQLSIPLPRPHSSQLVCLHC